jgi:plastocyanin domain-containing protein
MSEDKIIVTIIGILGILLTYWYFLGKGDGEISDVSEKGEVDILVEGGYKPEAISVKAGKKTILNFTRKDQSSCLEEIVIPDFKIRRYLPVGEKISVEIHPDKPGSYGFACGMNMFHGKIIVK